MASRARPAPPAHPPPPGRRGRTRASDAASPSRTRQPSIRPVLLFADRLVVESGAPHDGARAADHPGVATEEDAAAPRPHPGRISVLTHDVLDTPPLAAPLRIFPGTADSGDVGEPREFVSECDQLVRIAELCGAGSALQRDDRHRSPLPGPR